MPDFPEIVAHRGDAEHFPENTLPALEAAWQLGLRFAEFDVQLSADGVPYLMHDSRLDRTTHATGDLRLMNSGQLDGIDAGEPVRFGRRHAGTHLPRLAAAAELMAGLPSARAFVELKRASIVHHGRTQCVEIVLATLAPVRDRCVLISFDAEACRLARLASGLPIGWILDAPPASQLAALEALAPEYAFCDHRLLAAGDRLPGGTWKWAVYEVKQAAQAVELRSRGADLVESMAPARLAAELVERRPGGT